MQPQRHEQVHTSTSLFVLDPLLWDALSKGLNLPPQQAAILQKLLAGQSDKQIAAELGRSVPTVRTHLTRLFHRIGVRDRVELILYVFAESQRLWQSGALHRSQ